MFIDKYINTTTTNKKKYTRHKHILADGAVVIHIAEYVNNPDDLFTELVSKITWTRFKYQIYEREVNSPRLMNVLHFSDNKIINYDINLPNLLRIKARIEFMTKVKFNYAVLNYYRNGKDYISYHSDREVEDGQIVVSVTVGTTRNFVLKHKYLDLKHNFMLGNGDVLILNTEAIKTHYKHSVPKIANAGPRINVTFRE